VTFSGFPIQRRHEDLADVAIPVDADVDELVDGQVRKTGRTFRKDETRVELERGHFGRTSRLDELFVAFADENEPQKWRQNGEENGFRRYHRRHGKEHLIPEVSQIG
jgi:hypothetical protein